MNRPPKALAAILATIALPAVTLTAGVSTHGGAESPRAVISGTVSAHEWDELESQGWHGSPYDGIEALYPPEGQ